MRPRQSLSGTAMYSRLIIFLQTIETIASLAALCAGYVDLFFSKKNCAKIQSTK